MDQASLSLLITAVAVAAGMQVYSIVKIESLVRRTNGIIRFRPDLMAVKEVININMKMAIVYIVLYVLFFIIVARIFISGQMFQAITILFLFGIITLPLGLVGKHFENKIKTMKVEAEDPEIAKTFERYLVQWRQPRWQLSD